MEPIRRKTVFALVLLVLFGVLSVSFIVAEAGRIFLSADSTSTISLNSPLSIPRAKAKENKDVSEGEAEKDAQPATDSGSAPSIPSAPSSYGPLHSGVIATLFWAGEDSSDDNGHISNVPSAWNDEWGKDFGGVDDPEKRKGFLPAKFTPKENAFYFALPYNDFDENGDRKKEVTTLIPWFHEKSWGENDSLCKNRWVKITKGDKAAYAQWEDVGPFGEDDKDYVFGDAKPKSSKNEHAGIDLSPAATDYLGLSGEEKVNWQFVAENNVPDGPWKQTVTTSGIHWE